LGICLSARVTRRFLEAGYTAILLNTEYYRLSAIKTYLRLGFVPTITSAEIPAIWEGVCAQLNWPFVPKAWSAQV
jgi:mycothiol synthase